MPGASVFPALRERVVRYINLHVDAEFAADLPAYQAGVARTEHRDQAFAFVQLLHSALFYRGISKVSAKRRILIFEEKIFWIAANMEPADIFHIEDDLPLDEAHSNTALYLFCAYDRKIPAFPEMQVFAIAIKDFFTRVPDIFTTGKRKYGTHVMVVGFLFGKFLDILEGDAELLLHDSHFLPNGFTLIIQLLVSVG